MILVKNMAGLDIWCHERDVAAVMFSGTMDDIYDAHRRAALYASIDKEAIVREVTRALRNLPPSRGKRTISGARWMAELGQQDRNEQALRAVREMPVVTLPASVDDGERTIALTAATAAPVRRREYDFFGSKTYEYDEVLDMSPGSIRLGRLNSGAPLLDSHAYSAGTQAILGVVVPNTARISAGKLVASVKFSRSENGERAFQDAKDGILRSVSVGYMIHAIEIDDGVTPPRHRVIDWEPHEISAVAIPADENAKFREPQNALAAA
jgi:hypothetical protein